MLNNAFSRRSFLTGSALAGGAALGLLAGNASVAMAAPEEAASAGASDWLGEAPVIDEAELAEVIDTDILVVGNGMAGTVCALVAADNGGNVLLIEKNPSGVGLRSSAISALNSRYQQEVGVEINKEDIVNDFASYALNQCDMRLIRSWADNSSDVVNWLGDLYEKNGFTFHLEYNMPEGTRYKMWPTGHGTVNAADDTPASEQDVLAAMMEEFASRGGAFMGSTPLTCLIVEDGKVVGAYAQNADGQPIRINATKGVVVATGGYVNNKDMYIARQNGLEKSLTGPLNFGTAQGDGIKACLWAGAAMDIWPTTMIFDRGVVKPDYELGQVFDGGEFCHFTFATQPFLKVSQTGRRICNESSPYDYIVHAAQTEPGRAWYPIWDSSWKDDVTRFETIGCSTLFSREGSNHHAPGLDATEEDMEAAVENGFIIKADTLEELADGLGLLDKEAFLVEVENYNRMATAGLDDQFGKDAFRLSNIDEPPFYGMKMGGEPLCTLDGIIVNDHFQAMNADCEPIEGLYVIGNDSGRFYCHSYTNFGAGTNAGRCAAAGWVVGHELTA